MGNAYLTHVTCAILDSALEINIIDYGAALEWGLETVNAPPVAV